MGLQAPEQPPYQEFKRTFRGLKFVPKAFQAFDLGQNLAQFRVTLFEGVPQTLCDHENVALAAQLGDDNMLLVADPARWNVFIGPGQFLNRVHMHSAFVREGSSPDVGSPDVWRHIGDLVHKERELAQPFQTAHQRAAPFELEVGDQGGQVAVSDPLPVPVDRALNLNGSVGDRSHGIGDTHPAIVVGMDPHGHPQLGNHAARHLTGLFWHGAPIGVAQDHQVRAAVSRGLKRLESVTPVVLRPVEEMFGVVNHLATVRLQMSHRLTNHRQIFLWSHPQHFGHLQKPSLAKDGDGWSPGIEQQLHLRILVDRKICTARTPKRGNAGVPPGPFGCFFKKCDVFRVRPRPAALDVVHSKIVQLFSHPDLVRHAECNARSLCAVAQGGVVKGYLGLAHREKGGSGSPVSHANQGNPGEAARSRAGAAEKQQPLSRSKDGSVRLAFRRLQGDGSEPDPLPAVP